MTLVRIHALSIYEDGTLVQGANTNSCLPLPRSKNGYLVGSYVRRMWLHSAICDYTEQPRESVKSVE